MSDINSELTPENLVSSIFSMEFKIQILLKTFVVNLKEKSLRKQYENFFQKFFPPPKSKFKQSTT